MSILANFVVVQGKDEVRIGDNPGSQESWQKEFLTRDRRRFELAFLMIAVRGMTWAEKPAEVKINNKLVGEITPNTWSDNNLREEAAKHWVTQTITFDASDLEDGNNEIIIEAVKGPGGAGSDKYDDFGIKNVICFFQYGR